MHGRNQDIGKLVTVTQIRVILVSSRVRKRISQNPDALKETRSRGAKYYDIERESIKNNYKLLHLGSPPIQNGVSIVI